MSGSQTLTVEEVIPIAVSASATSVVEGEDVTFTATVHPEVSNIAWLYAVGDTAETPRTSAGGSSVAACAGMTSCTFVPPGTGRMYATGFVDNQKVSGGSEVVRVANACNTGDQNLDSSDVQSGLNSIWGDSNYGPDVPQENRREVAGWIVDEGGVKKFERFENPILGACGTDGDIDVVKPNNAVAWVHTHPYTHGEPQTSCGVYTHPSLSFPVSPTYKNLPSDDDMWTSDALNLPGYILDADGIRKFDGNGVTQNFGRCAY